MRAILITRFRPYSKGTAHPFVLTLYMWEPKKGPQTTGQLMEMGSLPSLRMHRTRFEKESVRIALN